jgi:hypothetical protein
LQCTSKLADDCQSFHVNPLVDIHIKLIAIKSKKSWKITKGELLTTSGPYPWSIRAGRLDRDIQVLPRCL